MYIYTIILLNTPVTWHSVIAVTPPRLPKVRSWRRQGVHGSVLWPRASRGSVAQFVGESYDGRAAVPSISREGVTQKSCRVIATQSIIKVTEQSACFGRGGVTACTERHVTGVLVCLSVAVRKLQVAILARSSLEMFLTVRII